MFIGSPENLGDQPLQPDGLAVHSGSVGHVWGLRPLSWPLCLRLSCRAKAMTAFVEELVLGAERGRHQSCSALTEEEKS